MVVVEDHQQREPSMGDITTIGLASLRVTERPFREAETATARRLARVRYYSRARVHSAYGQRCQIPQIVQSRALRERSQAHHVSAREIAIVDRSTP